VIHWQPGYVYPPVFHPPHLPLDPLNAAFFALVAIVVGALTYRRPALGVGVLLFCAPFDDARYIDGTSITVPKVALVAFIIALLLHRTCGACSARSRCAVCSSPSARCSSRSCSR